MIEIVTGVLGIAGTLIAWFFNPKRIIYAELDSIYKQLEILYGKRDVALATHDSDALTIITADIIKLFTRKNTLLLRIG